MFSEKHDTVTELLGVNGEQKTEQTSNSVFDHYKKQDDGPLRLVLSTERHCGGGHLWCGEA